MRNASTNQDLVRKILDRFSRYDAEPLLAHMDRTLASNLLATTASWSGGGHPSDARIASLSERLEAQPRPDPEVFLCLNRFAYATTAEDRLLALDELEHRLNRTPPAEWRRVRDGVLRFTATHGTVWRARGGELEQVAGLVSDGPWETRVLHPYPGLFADLLPAELYPVDGTPTRTEPVDRRLSEAFAVLERWAPEFREDFPKAVTVLAILPEGANPAASFSWRLNTFGELFLDPRAESPTRLAESILHEYLHQRLWQWWAFEEPEGLPSETATVVSPMTGKERPARTMLQALAIYVAAHRLLARMIAAGEGDDAAVDRRSGIAERVQPLAERLLRSIPSGTTAAGMVDWLVERASADAARPGVACGADRSADAPEASGTRRSSASAGM